MRLFLKLEALSQRQRQDVRRLDAFAHLGEDSLVTSTRISLLEGVKWRSCGRRPLGYFFPSQTMRRTEGKSSSLVHGDAFFSRVKKGNVDAFPIRRSYPSLSCCSFGCPRRAHATDRSLPGTHASGRNAHVRPIYRGHIGLVAEERAPRQWDFCYGTCLSESYC